MTNKTMRPGALDAAAELHEDKPSEGEETEENPKPAKSLTSSPTAKPSTPIGQRSDGTASAVKVIEEVATAAKAAVDGALHWAEKKVEKLGDETDSTGPYTSPATCAPTDLDPIASGVLPALPSEDARDGEKVKKNEDHGSRL